MTRRGKRRLLALALACVALAGAAAAAYTARQVQRARLARTRLAEGLAAYEAGDYGGAMRGLGYAYARKRADAQATLKLADARRRIPAENGAHLFTALRLAQTASEADPAALAPREMILELSAQVGFLTELREQADAILASHPDHAGALAARVQALRALGRRAEALDAAEAFARAHPADLAALSLLAECMREAERADAEIAARLDEAARAGPPSAGLGALRARLALAMKDPDKARALVIEAAAVDPMPLAEARDLLSLLDQMPPADRELADAADAVLARGLAAAHDEFLGVALERAWRLQEYRSLRPILDEVLSAPDAAQTASLGWAVLLARDLDLTDPASAAQAALLARHDKESEYWSALVAADAALRQDDPAGALVKLRTAAAAAMAGTLPDEALTLLSARAQAGVGEVRPAEQALLKLAARPGWRIADYTLARLLLAQQRFADALAVVGADLGVLQTHGGARLAAEAAAGLVGDPGSTPSNSASAITVLEQVRSAVPDDAAIAACLARGYLAAGRVADARGVVESIDPASLAAPEAAALLAALSAADPAAAEAFQARAGAQAAASPVYLLPLALRKADAGDVPAGRAILEEAITAAPESDRLDMQVLLGRFLDRYQAPDARRFLQGLAEAHARSVEAQRVFLESRSAWSENAGLAAAVERLKSLTGESGVQWRLFEARRLMTFSPDEGGRARALLLLGEARAADRDNPHVLYWLAEVHAADGDRAKAAEYLQQAVATGADGVFCYPRLVQLLQEQGRPDEAATTLRAFAAVRDISPELRRARATLLLRHALWDEAAADLALLRDAGDRTALLELAQVHRVRGQTAQARQAYTQLLADPSPSREAIIAACDFLAGEGDWDTARQRLLAIPSPSDPHEGTRLYASLLERRDRPAEARDLVAAGLDAGIAADYEWLARFHLRQNEPAKAEEVIAAGLARFPQSADLAAARSMVLLQTAQVTPEQTLEALSALAASSVARESPAPMQGLIDAMKHAVASPQDVDGYRKRLRDLTRASPQFVPAWRLLVESYAQRGEREEALLAARDAMKAAPADPGGAELTTLVLESLSRPTEALPAALEWKARDPRSLAARAAAARALLALDRVPQAVEETAPAVADAARRPAEPNSRALLLAWGRAMAAAGRADEAFNRLRPLADADPDFARAVWLRVAAESVSPAAACLRWMEAAESAAGSGPEADVDLGIGWGLAVRRLPELGEAGYERAERRLRSALAQATADQRPVALATLADLLSSKAGWLAGSGQAPAAAEARREALTLLLDASRAAPANPGYTLSAAVAAEALEDYAQAIALYESALKLDLPGDQRATVQNNLAYMVFLSGATGPALDRAAELVREALARASNPGFYDTLGWVEFARGRYAESAAAFQRALALEPGMLTGRIGALAAESRAGGANLEALRNRAAEIGTSPDLPKQIASIHSQTNAFLSGKNDNLGR